MDKIELITISIIFSIYIGANVWVLVALIITMIDMYNRDIEYDKIVFVLCFTALFFVAVTLLVSPYLYYKLITIDKIIYYEYIILTSFVAVIGTVLINVAIARLQASDRYVDDVKNNNVELQLDMVDILGLSVNFLMGGSCAFYYCKRQH